MPKSASLYFPFDENFQTRSLKRAETPNDAIKSAISAFLLTEKGQRRGNAIGSFLPSLVHKLIPSGTLPGLSEELKKELSTQFPGVIFNDIQITQELTDNVSSLRVLISFSTAITSVEQFQLLIL